MHQAPAPYLWSLWSSALQRRDVVLGLAVVVLLVAGLMGFCGYRGWLAQTTRGELALAIAGALLVLLPLWRPVAELGRQLRSPTMLAPAKGEVAVSTAPPISPLFIVLYAALWVVPPAAIYRLASYQGRDAGPLFLAFVIALGWIGALALSGLVAAVGLTRLRFLSWNGSALVLSKPLRDRILIWRVDVAHQRLHVVGRGGAAELFVGRADPAEWAEGLAPLAQGRYGMAVPERPLSAVGVTTDGRAT